MNITMYSTTTCTTCVGLGQWLEQNGYSYTKKMADSDDATMQEFMSLNDGMISVPFTVITNDNGIVTKITGYDRGAFKKVLQIP